MDDGSPNYQTPSHGGHIFECTDHLENDSNNSTFDEMAMLEESEHQRSPTSKSTKYLLILTISTGGYDKAFKKFDVQGKHVNSEQITISLEYYNE